MWFRRMWESPRFIPVLSVLTVIALAAAAFAVFGVLAQDNARERDRVAADIQACTRGNVLRGQVIEVGNANEQLVRGIIDVVLPEGSASPERAARVAEVRAALEPLFDRHRLAVDDIQLTDCRAAVPGVRSSTTTEGP